MKSKRESAFTHPEMSTWETGTRESLKVKELRLGQMVGSMKDSSLQGSHVGWEPRFHLKELELMAIGLEVNSLRVNLKKEYLRNRWRSFLMPRSFTKMLTRNME